MRLGAAGLNLPSRPPPLRRHSWDGVLVGELLTFLFMNFVVIPLSAFPMKLKFPPMVFVRGFLSHTFLVGIPIALAVRHFSFRYPDGDGPE